MIDAGKVSAFAVMANDLIAAFPDLLTVKDGVGSDYAFGTGRGIAGPVGLSDEVVTTMDSTLEAIEDDAAFQEFS